MSAASNWRLGLALALLTALMWGLLPIALAGVLVSMDSVTIAWYRFSLSALIAFIWYGWRSGPTLLSMFDPAHRKLTALVVAGLLCNYLLYIYGLDHTNPGASQIVIQVAPLLLLIASVLLLREAFSPWQWYGVVVFTTGLLLFFHQRIGASIATGPRYTMGMLLLLGAAISWVAYALAQKKLLTTFHAKHILLMICLGGSVFLLPFSEPAQIRNLNATELALLLFCGVNTIVAYGAFGLAMSYWEASRVSAIIPLTPLFTLLFTWLFTALFGWEVAAEPLDWLGVVGALTVVAGSTMAAIPRAKRKL